MITRSCPLVLGFLLASACGSAPADPVDPDASDAADTSDASDAADAELGPENDARADDASSPDLEPAIDIGDPDDAVDPEDRCEPPIRMTPTNGPASGGTRVEIFGEDWYIGALWWLATFDDVMAYEIYDGEPLPPCTLPFETPPHAPGRVPVSVNYGSRPIEGGEPFGTFTYE